jgi:hypothetical protein
VRIKVALAAGLLMIAITGIITLSRSPLTLARANFPETHHTLVSAEGSARACQAREVLPQGTSAIRLGMTTVIGPRVVVKILSGSRVVAEGSHAPGWDGASVTIPVRPLPHTTAPVKICFRLSSVNGTIELLGLPTRNTVAATTEGHALPGRVHIEYLRPSSHSWWSMANTVAWRLSIGRAFSGAWIVLLVLALLIVVVTLPAWLVTRELR